VSHSSTSPPCGRDAAMRYRLDRSLRNRGVAQIPEPCPILSMARFPEAEKRLLLKMICMKCYARNAPRATRCRKCRSKELRPKAKEARKE